MHIAGFTFAVSEIDGFRFIETIFPAVFDQRRLWAAASSYPTLWDENLPTVTLNDVEHMGEMDAEASKVLKWVLQQNQIRARLVATSWVTGGNVRAREQILEVLRDVGRPVDTVFEQREEAIAFLRARIREWREQTQ
jgi:hypothetical protein